MATKICEFICNAELVGKQPKDLKDLPIGDIFKDFSLTKETYQFMQVDNNFYSSEYLSRVSKYLKQSLSKL
jgi:hypothetical protein